MGSNHGSQRDRDRGPKRRRGLAKRRALPWMEGLESRQLLSIGDGTPVQPTNNNLADVKQGPLARAGSQLLTIYQEYQAFIGRNDQGQFHSSLEGLVMIRGDKVGVDVSGVGNFTTLQATLRNLGMEITAVDNTRRIAEGFLPISQLVTVARNPQVSGILPIFNPYFHSVGSATNQGERVLRADTARTQFNLDGTGVKVGVLSDSVDRFDNPAVAGVGLAESIATGDLPNNVQVIQDEAAGGNNSDEGRAMLEQIYDIVPGASLAFATATGGELNFANNIRALAQAGSQVIVDDVIYFAEPMFQDGIVGQAVIDVVNNQNASYFSSAGNSADGGYHSNFRGVNATVGGITGRWMNFNPNGGTQTTLPITVRVGGAPVVFQWDNPYYVTNGVTSDLDIYFLDAAGTIVGQSQTNNILQGTPLEIIGLPATATQMAIQVQPGSPDVGRVGVIVVGDSASFDKSFGSAGGTIYGSTWGHETANETIGTGAVPWWVAPPFTTTGTITNEVFSSWGPSVFLFNPDGTRKAAAETRLKPDVSGPDANDTSFFIPGVLLSTVNPPPRTGPATGTELDGNALPNFFGTSSSAPNLAAVAALMKQLAPGATPTAIRNAMIASAVPLNGAAQGAWDVQGGFGLVQADAALTAIDVLRVVTVTPAPGSSLTTSPSSVVVTFSRPINATTLQASDLVFNVVPPGVTLTVGTPTLINATTVSFPLNIVTASGVKANGSYAYTLVDRSITSTDGRLLAAFSGGFALNDITAPKVANTNLIGRTVAIQFTEAMRPSSITAGTIVLYRMIGSGTTAQFIPVSLSPGARVFYDAATNRAIIDLTQVAQESLPSGTYVIQVHNSVTDLVGNLLDGEFFGPPPKGNNSTFPSGDNKPLPLEDNDNDNFNQVISNIQLTAPRVTSLDLDQTAGPPTVNPRITGTLYNRQAIEVYFSQPMTPASINLNTIRLYRTNGRGSDLSQLTQITHQNLAVTYDAVANKAVLILSQVPANLLPEDTYLLAVLREVTDQQGDLLDGEFGTAESFDPNVRRSLFPTGDRKLGALEQNDRDTFLQLIPDLRTSGPARFTRFDSGIIGDTNTNYTRPVLTGQVSNSFPGAISGLTVVAQFEALHGGILDLNTGPGGRGFTGNPDVVTTTDANGRFTIVAPADLPDGFHQVRLVVVGQSDAPPLPGLSVRIETAFRIDTTKPAVEGAFIDGQQVLPGSLRSSLTAITLRVRDDILPQNPADPLVVPTQLSLPALDPATATNISNYTLLNLGADNAPGGIGANADQDLSRFITAVTFTPTSNRQQVSDPYRGDVNLAIAPGLPAGRYLLLARRPQPGYTGITDAAGNPIDGDPNKPGAQDFLIELVLEPQPVFITAVKALSPLPNGPEVNPNDPSTFTTSDPRAFFELPVPGIAPAAAAPPTDFFIDFSSPLRTGVDYSNAVQLIRSADPTGPTAGVADGDFGVDSSFTNGQGYTRVNGVTVTLSPTNPNRLVVSLPPNTSLVPDYYRLFMPNTGASAVIDVFGNQLDGEFLGNRDGKGGFETLLPNGQFRAGLSGDGITGGAFETGYVVVPGEDPVTHVRNIIFARPDYVDSPFLDADDPTGSIDRPFPTLAPEALPTAANGGDLNSVVNFGTGFDSRLDRNQNGHFDRSALFAAQVASSRGPVVVIALPAAIQRDPVTGITSQATFVLAAPAGSTDPVRNNASASVPFNTTLVFDAGSTLKLQNASLFVQNQGAALQVRGGTEDQRVTFTSFSDDSVGGDTNRDGAPGAGGNSPGGGDWGGLVFRNFDQAGRSNLVPFPVDGRLKGPNGADARSGADDAISEISFATVRFGGGPVPRTSGQEDGPITLFNARPVISNVRISDSEIASGAATGGSGAITADFNSFREDQLARGPLIRRVDLFNNSINGIFIRAELTGQARQTNAIDYIDPTTANVSRSFAIDDPLPHVLTTRMIIGQEELVTTGGLTTPINNRMYVQPGMMFKLQRGAGIDVNSIASINVGDRTYVRQFDAQNNVAPLLPDNTPNPNFRPNTVGDAKVLFTSVFDDNASTAFFDPNTGASTVIVRAIDTDSGGPINLPTPGNVPALARWGGVLVDSGGRAVIDEAIFQFGGGTVNVTGGTVNRNVLSFGEAFGGLGTHASVTSNDFFDNADTPIAITPNGLLAADPLRPLLSGNPFFRDNIMQRNGINGLGVFPDQIILLNPFSGANLLVDSVWDDTDVTYVLRDEVVLGPFAGALPPLPNAAELSAVQTPNVTLTLQSNLPDTLLANGQRIARPGESLLVKLLGSAGPVDLSLVPGANLTADDLGGAGFIVGVDNGTDPTGDFLVDQGVNSQIRILGIAGNETTGQQRVPVVITSLHDTTASKTVRGVTMGDATAPTISGDTTAPSAGDGGVIYFGGLSLPDYNLYDPRDGNIIDNADIRYLSRIEMQGGGITDVIDANLDNAVNGDDLTRLQRAGRDPRVFLPGPDNKLGTPDDVLNPTFGQVIPILQNNASRAMTISNSNLSNFRDIGVYSHPGFDLLGRAVQDSGPTVTTSQIVINDTDIIQDLDVEISLTHPSVDDLVLTLIAPGGARFTLANRVPNSGANFTNTIFDSDVVTPINAGSAPYTGRFAPVDSLTALDGTSPAGTWTLEIQNVGQSQGQLTEFRLTLRLAPNRLVDTLAPTLPVSIAPRLVSGVTSRIGGQRSQPTALFMVGNTISNMPIGVRVNGLPAAADDDGDQSDRTEFVALHNTFYNNAVGVHIEAAPLAPNPVSHVHFVPMNNIFANSSTAAIEIVGNIIGSQGQYNLFSGNKTDVSDLPTSTGFPNFQPVSGDPRFRDPANGDFSLQLGSAAIDAARSEVALDFGDTTGAVITTLRPISTQVLTGTGIGNRNTNFRMPDSNPDPTDFLTLPGYPQRTFRDQFIASLPAALGGSATSQGSRGPASNGATFNYIPIDGVRDSTGFLRFDDPNTANVGVGSRPFFDIGANEFRLIDPPNVTAVTAVLDDPTSPTGVRVIDFYAEGGVAGSRTTPRELRIQFDTRLDPNTINNRTVVLQAAGGDGLFGNSNNANDRTIDLSGRLRYEAATRTLVVDLAGLGASLGNDQFRLTLFGNGQDVLRDPQGNTLDAENTVGGSPTGAQLPLPSGNGIPGGNFFLRFDIDATPSSIVAGSLRLAAASDSGRTGDSITGSNRPSFTGTIQDPGAPAASLVGQTVIIDLPGADNVFGTSDDVLNAGTALTTAGGAFVVTVGTDGANTGLVPAGTVAPDSNVNVGPDGWLGPNPQTSLVDDVLTSYTLARVRVVDQSGNVSDPTTPASQVRFVVDTQGPRITAANPVPGSAAAATGGTVPVTLIVNENVDPASVNATTVRVVRSGGDSIFGNANDVTLTISGNIQVNPLRNAQGSMELRFNVTGATANDLYRVTLVGSATGVRDWAANPLDGELTGGFPTGNGTPGGDFNLDFVVFDAANPTRLLFVDDDATPSTSATGSRNDPFSAIMDQTLPGPDNKLGTADDVLIPGAMSVAGVGDTIAVLPGLYTEAVVMKSLVRLVSAATSSTDTSFIAGQALQTVIRPPTATTGNTIGVSATNLFSLPNFFTELAGFTIVIPLLGDPANGPIESGSWGVLSRNSNVLINKNYVINAGHGIVVALDGVGAATPRIESNGVVGNNHGITINAANAVTFGNGPTRIANNTIAFNNIGLLTVNSPAFSQSVLATVDNNIFAGNFTGSTSRTGSAIFAATPTILTLRANLFNNNGVSPTSGADDVLGTVGSAFNPSRLSTTPDINGNFVGNPGFANPRDPRPSPQGQGPAVFFLDANFDLTGVSVAIDNAWHSQAPAQDFRSRTRVDIPNVGRPGWGPADIGAFERNGQGGIPAFGGSGTVLAATLGTTPGATTLGAAALGGTVTAAAATTSARGGQSVTVRFNQPVDRSTVQPADLVLTGALDAVNPAHATSLTWIDDQAVAFNLSGAFGNGTVAVEVPDGAVRGRDGLPMHGYTTTFPVSNPTAVAEAAALAAVTTPIAAPPTDAPKATTPTATTTPRGPRARRQAAWARFLSRRRVHA